MALPRPLPKALTSKLGPTVLARTTARHVTRNMRTALSFAGTRIVSAPALSRTAKSQARRYTPIKMSGLQINVSAVVLPIACVDASDFGAYTLSYNHVRAALSLSTCAADV